MKEFARKIMKAQWTQERLKHPVIRGMLEEWTIDSLRRSLKPDGKPRFDEFIKNLQNGEQVALSNYIDMFLGYDFKSKVNAESLTELQDQPIICVANHTDTGPMRGQWEHAAISYYVRQKTNKETRLLHGYDPNTTQDLFREKLHKSINSMLIRDRDPHRSGSLLLEAIRKKDSMLLYPEGNSSKALKEALLDSGRLIDLCIKSNINLVTCAARYQNEVFFLNFDRISSEELKEIDRHESNNLLRWKMLADYAMETIAQHLPENQHGYYRKPLIQAA